MEERKNVRTEGKNRNQLTSRSFPEGLWKDGFGEILLWELIAGESWNDKQLDSRILEHRMKLLFRFPSGMV